VLGNNTTTASVVASKLCECFVIDSNFLSNSYNIRFLNIVVFVVCLFVVVDVDVLIATK
jgi:hypothetical protein